MLSKSPAPKYLLIVPLVLLIVVLVLSFLVFQNLRAAATNTPAVNQENKTPEPQNPEGNPNQNPNPGTKPSVNDAMNKVPAGYYPANKCPEVLVKEPSSGNNFAIEGGEKYSLSNDGLAWITANCKDIETLTF